jgi:hypothetical protein
VNGSGTICGFATEENQAGPIDINLNKPTSYTTENFVSLLQRSTG